jgi:class 3 adenylate cyclase/tetratricopeptide (TPR) repeat protein
MDDEEKIEQAISGLEQQRSLLGDAVVDAALAGLREQLARLRRRDDSATVDLSGERKLVTILFADISGFTAMSDVMDSEDVRSLMNECFSALVPVVSRYGGTVDKFIGDEIMALFGAPAIHENDPECALRASLGMVDALEAFNLQRGTELAMHFGVETGTVVAGGLGAEGHQQYSVMGDAVNLAARLEDAAEAGQILVGPHVHRLTARLFDFEALPPMRLKGKAEVVQAYRLAGASGDATWRDLTTVASPMLGRDIEFGQLADAVRSLGVGRGKVLAITGEPGLGKSRLVAEARNAFGGQVRWAEGRAQSHTRGVAYAGVQSMLDGLLGVAPNTSPASAAAALRATLAQTTTGLCDSLYPYLARLRDLPLDPGSKEELEDVLPEALRQRMQRAFVDFVAALSDGRPLVLVWEDLHWIDPSSLSLLESLLPLTRRAPLLLVLVFRPQEGAIQSWYEGVVSRVVPQAETLELGPLGNADSERLAENLLQIQDLPNDTLELILAKAEGNPFFLEELLRSLVETGVLLVEGERMVAARSIDALAIPDTVQGVVAARIDRLSQDKKRILQDASVIGRVFQQPVLAYVLERENLIDLMDDALVHLQRLQLIRRVQVQLEYIFKHAVTQEVAYQSLLLARRKQLHRVIAEAIESLFPDRLEMLCETLAYHCQKAGAVEQAVRYLLMAADRAGKTYANAEAIGFYRAGFELAGDLFPEQAVQLLEGLGDVLARIGQTQEARDAYADALARVSPAQVTLRARLHRKSGTTWVSVRQADKSLPSYAAAEAALGADPGHSAPAWLSEWLDVQLDLGWAYYWLNGVEELNRILGRIAPLIEEGTSTLQRIRIYNILIQSAWRRERYVVSEETLENARKGLAAARESGDDYHIARQLLCLGLCQLHHDEVAEARTSLEQALAIAERIGSLEDQLMTLGQLCSAHRRERNVGALRTLAARCIELATEGNVPFYTGAAYAHLAWADWRDGDLAAARRYGQEVLDLWGSTPSPAIYLAALPLLAISLSEGNIAEAVDYAGKVLAPYNVRISLALESVLQEAVETWATGDAVQTAGFLNQGIELAKETRWLRGRGYPEALSS